MASIPCHRRTRQLSQNCRIGAAFVILEAQQGSVHMPMLVGYNRRAGAPSPSCDERVVLVETCQRVDVLGIIHVLGFGDFAPANSLLLYDTPTSVHGHLV